MPRISRFLQGLFHFIEINANERDFMLAKKHYSLMKAQQVGVIRQQYSHFTLEADIYLLPTVEPHGSYWHSAEELVRLPMSMAEQKILKLILCTQEIA